MKVTMNIAEDKILRKEVVSIIKNEIHTTVKEELKRLVLDEVGAKSAKEYTDDKIKTLVKDEIARLVNHVTRSDLYDNEYKKLQHVNRVVVNDAVYAQVPYIKEQIRKQAAVIVKEYTAGVLDEMLQDKIQYQLATLLGSKVASKRAAKKK